MVEALSPAVTQFLAEYIQSLEQLEILLLLRAGPDRLWSPADIYEVVRSSPSSVTKRLESFVALGFLTQESGSALFRYAPPDPLRAALDETAVAYQKWRIRVIEVIFAPEKDAVQNFADAFKVRKK
jgi:hypothetical protein